MKRSIFKQYFIIFSSIVFVSALIFSSISLLLYSRYFKADKYKLLGSNAMRAAEITKQNYNNNLQRLINYELISSAYKVLGAAIDADIFLIDLDGKIKICTNDSIYLNSTFITLNDIMNQINENKIYEFQGNLEQVYHRNRYIVALPIIFNREMVGAVIVTTSTELINKSLFDMIKIFGISFIVVIMISMGIISVVTNKLVSPLKEMARVTKIFSKGDFREKLSIDSSNEIGELSRSLNDMAESLEKTEETRRDFIANVSHELRTPMTTIQGFIDGILDGVIPPEDHGHYLKIVSDEIKRLSIVVNSMLNIARIESGNMKISKEKFDINEMVCQVIFGFEHEIVQKNVQVYGLDHNPVFVVGDKNMIHQVIYNLVENAIKFTDSNGYIKIRYKITDKLVYTGIKNSGEGVDPENIKNIFDKFYKVDKSRGIDKKGVGLGLHIVKLILNLHDSDVEIESKPGEYTEFFFWLNR